MNELLCAIDISYPYAKKIKGTAIIPLNVYSVGETEKLAKALKSREIESLMATGITDIPFTTFTRAHITGSEAVNDQPLPIRIVRGIKDVSAFIRRHADFDISVHVYWSGNVQDVPMKPSYTNGLNPGNPI